MGKSSINLDVKITQSFDCRVSEKELTVTVTNNLIVFEIKDGSGKRVVTIERSDFGDFISHAFSDALTLTKKMQEECINTVERKK